MNEQTPYLLVRWTYDHDINPKDGSTLTGRLVDFQREMISEERYAEDLMESGARSGNIGFVWYRPESREVRIYSKDPEQIERLTRSATTPEFATCADL